MKRVLSVATIGFALGVLAFNAHTYRSWYRAERALRIHYETLYHEQIPCDQAVKESRNLFEAQLKLRNQMIGDQNVLGQRTAVAADDSHR